jgi:hypothetical protein
MISSAAKRGKTGKSPCSASEQLQSSFAGNDGRRQQATEGYGIDHVPF